MKRLVVVAAVLALGSSAAGLASNVGWTSGISFTNQVASSPVGGGGYPVPAGQTFPNPGTCGAGSLDSNHSESWLAVKPGSEDIVGSSKSPVSPVPDQMFNIASRPCEEIVNAEHVMPIGKKPVTKV